MSSSGCWMFWIKLPVYVPFYKKDAALLKNTRIVLLKVPAEIKLSFFTKNEEILSGNLWSIFIFICVHIEIFVSPATVWTWFHLQLQYRMFLKVVGGIDALTGILQPPNVKKTFWFNMPAGLQLSCCVCTPLPASHLLCLLCSLVHYLNLLHLGCSLVHLPYSSVDHEAC